MAKLRIRKRDFKKNIFDKGRNSYKGYMSVTAAVASIILIAVSVFLSYHRGGNAGYIVGGLSMIGLLLAVAGVFIGVWGFGEKNKIYWPCYLGSILNSIIVVFIGMLYIAGI